jgi:hypothetical protein
MARALKEKRLEEKGRTEKDETEEVEREEVELEGLELAENELEENELGENEPEENELEDIVQEAICLISSSLLIHVSSNREDTAYNEPVNEMNRPLINTEVDSSRRKFRLPSKLRVVTWTAQ